MLEDEGIIGVYQVSKTKCKCDFPDACCRAEAH